MRAQITVFIIIGVLILAAFAVVFYAASLMSVEKRASQEFLVSQPISDYVASCLEGGVKEGLVLLGSQGGRIFVSQGGVHELHDFVSFDGVSVPFSVEPPEGSFAVYFSEPPYYPWINFPYADNEEVFTGFFGFNRLPPLYKNNPDGAYVAGSIQESFESFIENYVVSCANWASFPAYKISAGLPNASLVFASTISDIPSEQFLSVSLKWPVDVRGQSSFYLDEFAVKVPVRLSSVYFFVAEQVDKDVSDISFEPHSVGSFDVVKHKVGADSVLAFVDALSIVDGVPFEFNVARKNRRPALWHIDAGNVVVYTGQNDVSVIDDELVITTSCGSDYAEYRFQLRASDPDDDVVSFDASPERLMFSGSRSVRVTASDDYLEDWQDIDVEVVPCVPT